MKLSFKLLFILIISFFQAKSQITNPILPGFYPDPSICRVGNNYYLVNSSFSYYPGIPIFHSKDLQHWKQIGHVLTQSSQLNITNQGISEGIYAPTIRYHNGTFYLISTFVGGRGNFIVTAKDPAGPWSDPIWLSEINGIDPSLFFDENGEAFIINNGPPPNDSSLYKGHRAIWLQKFDIQTMKLVGSKTVIVNGGTDITKNPIWIEGPHLFKKNEYYFLIAAEGGTEENHSEVVFRSKSIFGPYESFSGNPILTQRDLPYNRPNPITCSGHSDFVQTTEGKWICVFLACQPYEANFFNTGRQTFLLPVNWNGQWPVILERGKVIPKKVELTGYPISKGSTFSKYSQKWVDKFDKTELKSEWNFIRTPVDKWYTVGNNKLVLFARPVDISVRGNPSFIGRRQQHSNAIMTTVLQLEKDKDVEAGIVAFQNEKYYYKFIVKQTMSRSVLLVSSDRENIAEMSLNGFKSGSKIYLKIKSENSRFACFYSIDNKRWIQVGNSLDATLLSTHCAGGFVGCYFGLYAYAKTPTKAIFNWVSYEEGKGQ